MADASTSAVPFRRLWLAVLCGYLALGATIQELPAFVVQRFHGGAVLSGTAVGIAFLATACSRPIAGLFADHGRARRVVMLGGTLGAVGGLGHLWAPDVTVLLASRLLMGAGEAALFSGALPWVLTEAPAHRRGRVAGWFGLSMWGGLAGGPVLATVLDPVRGTTGVWVAVTALGLVSAALVFTTAGQAAPTPIPAGSWRRLVPGGSALPGMVFGLAAYGYGTVAALLVLHLREDHIGGAGLGLALFALGFLLTRTVGSPWVDRYGAAATASASLATEALGLLLVGTLATETGVLLGAVLAGAGVALMYPSTVAMTLHRTGALRPGTAVGAMTSFWDLGIMVAGPVGGVIALTAGYPAAFWAAVGTSLAALTVVASRLRAATHRHTAEPQGAEQVPAAEGSR
jgi:MFS family permease